MEPPRSRNVLLCGITGSDTALAAEISARHHVVLE